MAEIPGWVFVAVGLFVGISSYIADASTKSNKFALFVLAGIAFVAFGIIKILIFRKKKTVYQEESRENIAGTKYCWNCRQVLMQKDKYCFNCGKQQK